VLLQAKYIALNTGHTEEEVTRDFARPRYFNPFEAKEYGIIDQVGLGQDSS
jgi:ATP-dependent Clp protease protease subunit